MMKKALLGIAMASVMVSTAHAQQGDGIYVNKPDRLKVLQIDNVLALNRENPLIYQIYIKGLADMATYMSIRDEEILGLPPFYCYEADGEMVTLSQAFYNYITDSANDVGVNDWAALTFTTMLQTDDRFRCRLQ